MPNDLVRWPGLENLFKFVYPNSVRDALDNETNVPVMYKGAIFLIVPQPPDFKVSFDVYGPASVPSL